MILCSVFFCFVLLLVCTLMLIFSPFKCSFDSERNGEVDFLNRRKGFLDFLFCSTASDCFIMYVIRRIIYRSKMVQKSIKYMRTSNIIANYWQNQYYVQYNQNYFVR